MTTTADETALLRAILTHPAEDTPRLMYADWLDENAETGACRACEGCGQVYDGGGSGLVTTIPATRSNVVRFSDDRDCPTCHGTGWASDGRAARAEFIRVQIGIVQVERDRVTYLNDGTDWQQCTGVSADWCPNCGNCQCPDREDRMDDAGCPLHRPDSPHDCLDMLSYRERRLTDRATAIWRGWSRRWFGWGTGTDTFGSCLTPNEVDPRVRRGFVAEVRMPVAAFMAAAKGLFSVHPIETVVLTDREPEGFQEETPWWWFMAGELTIRESDDPSVLPDALWRVFHDHPPYSTSSIRRTLGWEFATRDEAVSALSEACVAYGRGLVGLPPLPA